jgi:hypothetical protein
MAEKYPSGFNRRHFLAGLGTATASASISPAEATEVIRIGPRQRLESDIEAWNVGLITAHRPELTPAENGIRNSSLQGEIRKGGFGLLIGADNTSPRPALGRLSNTRSLSSVAPMTVAISKAFCGRWVESLIRTRWCGKVTTERFSCSP